MGLAATRSIDGSGLPVGPEAALAGLARPVADHALPLLAASGGHLLLLTATHQPIVPFALCWTGPADPIPLRQMLDPEDFRLNERLSAFEAAGRALLLHLARRWPSYAVPPVIGLVTDGGGVAFTSDHRLPLSADWLAAHRDGRCVSRTLRAFSGHGAWSLLTERSPDQRIH